MMKENYLVKNWIFLARFKHQNFCNFFVFKIFIKNQQIIALKQLSPRNSPRSSLELCYFEFHLDSSTEIEQDSAHKKIVICFCCFRRCFHLSLFSLVQHALFHLFGLSFLPPSSPFWLESFVEFSFFFSSAFVLKEKKEWRKNFSN